ARSSLEAQRFHPAQAFDNEQQADAGERRHVVNEEVVAGDEGDKEWQQCRCPDHKQSTPPQVAQRKQHAPKLQHREVEEYELCDPLVQFNTQGPLVGLLAAPYIGLIIDPIVLELWTSVGRLWVGLLPAKIRLHLVLPGVKSMREGEC